MLKTPLNDLHNQLGAKMVEFAGYEMPVQYPLGVMGEHQHTRQKAGFFDVSHMGQVIIRAKTGDVQDAAKAFETLVPMDICGLPEERQRYALFTNDRGGILDDLMITNRGDELLAIVNAACKTQDFEHMKTHLSDKCDVFLLEDRALFALQGPKSAEILEDFIPGVADMRFMDSKSFECAGEDVWISRSGYTGEDGYEISVHEKFSQELAKIILRDEQVEPIGLGARDSLRLEAGLCLYGNDIDTDTTPVEAALNWSIQKIRRQGGEREGGFPGADIILDQLENGSARKRVGILPDGRAPMRQGTKLYAGETDENEIGEITSGGFGPTISQPISIGYVQSDYSQNGTEIFADVRGRRLPAHIAPMPFVPANFKR